MIIFLSIIGYFLIAAGFSAWDSFIGMPVKWDPRGDNNMPCWVAALLWPFAIPMVSLIKFSNFLEEAKENRIQKEKTEERLRIVAEKERKRVEEEEARLLAQIEAEMENETKNSHSA